MGDGVWVGTDGSFEGNHHRHHATLSWKLSRQPLSSVETC